MADDNNLEIIYQYAEKAFIRMQANEVLTRCLDTASLAPVQRLVESLVLAGPDSLDVFREILAETGLREAQLEDDLSQVMSSLRTNLGSYGVDLGRYRKPNGLVRIHLNRFRCMLRDQGVAEEEQQSACLQLFKDAREIMTTLTANYSLLKNVENYLQDWMWGVVYHTVRDEIIQM